jgi:hypothetical protein
MTGMPHALETLRIRIATPGVLRRALGHEARTVITPAEALVHCHLCGAPHRRRANHFCPRLYGR